MSNNTQGVGEAASAGASGASGASGAAQTTLTKLLNAAGVVVGGGGASGAAQTTLTKLLNAAGVVVGGRVWRSTNHINETFERGEASSAAAARLAQHKPH